LVCRLILGDGSETVAITPYFDSMPRSLFTVFRCTFGDCEGADGEKIAEIATTEYGWAWGVGYSIFIFFTTIGVFNVVSAIFVEATVAATVQGEKDEKAARMRNEKLFATRIKRILQQLLEVSTSSKSLSTQRTSQLAEALRSNEQHNAEGEKYLLEIAGLEVKCEDFDLAVTCPAVVDAFADLDIEGDDLPYLSDILDPQNDKIIKVADLVDGIRRLRGDPRRSDIVAIDLMVRDIQKAVDQIRVDTMKVKAIEEADHEMAARDHEMIARDHEIISRGAAQRLKEVHEEEEC